MENLVLVVDLVKTVYFLEQIKVVVLQMLITEKNSILVLGKDNVQGINGTTIYAEKLYKINFTEKNKKFCLSLH